MTLTSPKKIRRTTQGKSPLRELNRTDNPRLATRGLLKCLLLGLLAAGSFGATFARASGMRFRYDPSRPKFDVVTVVELGDIDRGYRAIDTAGKDARLYSLTCPLMLGAIHVAIPKYTKGKLPLVAKNKEGQPLKSKVEALDDPRSNTPDLLPPTGKVDSASVATSGTKDNVREIKEWQAIMDHLRSLPAKKGELPVIPVDARAAEMRAIKAG